MILPSSSSSREFGANSENQSPNILGDLNQLASLRFGQQKQPQVEDESEPRLILFYVGTSTTTSTVTTFTRTTTFSIAVCTPFTLVYNACG
jgi:hypothetical protein